MGSPMTEGRCSALWRCCAGLAVLVLAFGCGDGPAGPTPDPTVASVVVTGSLSSLSIGDTTRLSAVARDTDGTAMPNVTFTWSSTASSIASVSATGLVTALGAGSATIEASAAGHDDTFEITVLPDPVASVASVTLTPDSLDLEEAESGTLSVTLSDSSGTALSGRMVAWLSRDESVATVSSAGVVSTVGPGATWVLATSEEVSDSAFVRVREPLQVTGQSVATGVNHSCALTSRGEAYCWGLRGFLGDGRGEGEGFSAPVPVSGGHRFVHIDIGGQNTVALTAEGVAWVWGLEDNAGTTHGFGSHTGLLSVPVRMPGELRFTTVDSEMRHACGLTTEGDAYCWGDNSYGQLGDSTRVSRGSPALVSGGHKFVAIATGQEHTVALKENGEAWAWGDNQAGQLGDGTVTRSLVPVAVSGGLSFVAIDAQFYHALGITADGTTYGWGNMHYLSPTTSDVPVAVPGGHKFVQVSAGRYHVLARKADGSLWAWGSNTANNVSSGALGDGSGVDQFEPVPVAGGHTYRTMSAGVYYSVGIGTDGNAYGWGDNSLYRAIGGPGSSWQLLTPEPPIAPVMKVNLSPWSYSVLQGQSAAGVLTVERESGGFTLDGPVTLGSASVSISGSMEGVSVAFDPATLGASERSSSLAVTATASAPVGTGSVDVTVSASGADSQTFPVSITVVEPPPPGEEYACPTGDTPLPAGYHCMTANGTHTAGKYSDPELHGTWVDEGAGVCITWDTTGKLSYARYNAGGTITETGRGEWGAMINLDGSRYQNDRYWMVFTEMADAQTRLLAYDSETNSIVNWSFSKRSCPF